MSLNKCITWDEINPVDRALLIINSMPNDYNSVDLILKALHNLVSKKGLWVIAAPHWQEYLAHKGLSPDMVQLTVLSGEYETLTFLEQPYTIDWALEQKPQLIMGSLAHNLYNEEIKEIFERRICLFLGEALFMAHTLPNQYIYLMNTQDLFERRVRQEKVKHFQNISKAIINDLYQTWLDKEQPLFDDDPNFKNEEKILARHLGQAVLSYDEVSEISLQHVDPYITVINGWTQETIAYEARLTKLQQEINIRDEMLNTQENELRYLKNRWSYWLFRKIFKIEDKLKAILGKG